MWNQLQLPYLTTERPRPSVSRAGGDLLVQAAQCLLSLTKIIRVTETFIVFTHNDSLFSSFLPVDIPDPPPTLFFF